MKPLLPVIAFLFLLSAAGYASHEPDNEALDFTLGPEWKVGNIASTRVYTIKEFIRDGDDINNWKELVTIQKFWETSKPSPEDVLNDLKRLREKECRGATEWTVIDKNENSILYEWQEKPCLGWPDQHEIARIIVGKYGRYLLRYTAKVRELAPETRAEWIKTLSGARIAASSEVASGAAQNMISITFASWGHNPTTGAHLDLVETGRKNVKNRTQVSYRFAVSGFPAGKTYMLWTMQSVDHKTYPMQGPYLADATGKLVCEEQTPSRGRSRCFSLDHVSIDIDNYHKGEPTDYMVTSTDGTVRAYARAYPFPILAQDGKCSLNVELEDTKFTSFVIRGAGFEPGENVKTSSSFGSEATAGTEQASPTGEFAAATHADLSGANSGSATFAATGSSCRPVVTYEWGKAAKKVQ
jgi:hypothetical protein